MIPGCVVGIVLGVIFDLYFGFHLNGYVFDVLASAGVTGFPEPGEILNRPSQHFLILFIMQAHFCFMLDILALDLYHLA